MPKPLHTSVISGDFNIDWNLEIQELTRIRRTIMSQEEMAQRIGVSLKSIQRFENYKSINARIMYYYKVILEVGENSHQL